MNTCVNDLVPKRLPGDLIRYVFLRKEQARCRIICTNFRTLLRRPLNAELHAVLPVSWIFTRKFAGGSQPDPVLYSLIRRLKKKLKSSVRWKQILPSETYIYPSVARKNFWRHYPGIHRLPEVHAFPVIFCRDYLAAGFLSKKMPVNGSKLVADVPFRRILDLTVFKRAITTVCFVMQIRLPKRELDPTRRWQRRQIADRIFDLIQ